MTDEKKEVRLNIGAGLSSIPGFINIDISPKADISLNLSEDKLPFDDNSVDLIFTYHTLEHVPNYLFALSEMYRVLKHGGRLLVGLPYVTHTDSHLVNPYHIHNFNESSFDYFDVSKLKGSAAEESPVFFKKVFHRYQYFGLIKIFPSPIKKWCRRHLLNIVERIDFGLIVIKDTNDIPVVTKKTENMFRQEFQRCLTSRVLYD